MHIDETGLLVFGLLVGVPAAVLACLSPRWRIACFFLGLVLGFGTLELIASPHDTMIVLIFVGFGISIAALLVEIPAFAIRTVRRRRATERGETVDEQRPLRFRPRR